MVVKEKRLLEHLLMKVVNRSRVKPDDDPHAVANNLGVSKNQWIPQRNSFGMVWVPPSCEPPRYDLIWPRLKFCLGRFGRQRCFSGQRRSHGGQHFWLGIWGGESCWIDDPKRFMPCKRRWEPMVHPSTCNLFLIVTRACSSLWPDLAVLTTSLL